MSKSETWFVKCDECNGLGEVYDNTPCRKCGGDGKAEEEVYPVELEDIERDWIWPMDGMTCAPGS